MNVATDPIFIFIVQALAILVLPVAVWRFLHLRGAIPLVVVQILVGIALGPTLFGRFAPKSAPRGDASHPGVTDG